MSITNTDIVWERLLMDIGNRYGTAGLMGNLFAESSMNPLCKTGGDKKISGQQYTNQVDDGVLSKEAFCHDGVAYGLAQWRYWSRKEQLYLLAKEKGRSIGDIDLQLDFILKELKTYKTVWNTLTNATSVKQASDIVLERYEKPANVGESAKKKRSNAGEKYYAIYISPILTSENKKLVIVTHDNVNLREGNGKKYASVGRAKKAGATYPYVATSVDNWHAIIAEVNHKQRVVWISGDYSIVSE